MKRWLSLHPDTFIFYDKEKILFYNTTLNVIYETKRNKFLYELRKRLSDLTNLYCVEIEDSQYDKNLAFFESLSKNHIGDIIYSNYSDRPISLPPKFKLHYDVEQIKNDYQNYQAGYILNFLNEITIYVNGNNEEIKDNIYIRQAIFPMNGNKKLRCCDLTSFMENLKGSALHIINIVCKIDIINEYNSFINYLVSNGYYINFYFKNDEINQCDELISKLATKGKINIVCFVNQQIEFNHKYKYYFLINELENIEHVESKKSKTSDYELTLIYNELNKNFFKENVYTKKTDFTTIKKVKRNIFANEFINTNFFGKLTILPNNRIYSNINFEFVGNIKDSPYEIIYKEIINSKAWFLTRNEVEPCKKCRYKFICPPISNYELISKKNNLCHIR